MGVFCQIHLRRPPDGVYKPGSIVSGVVKYAIDEDTYYKDIYVCLRGKGRCHWSEGAGNSRRSYTGTEDYVNIKKRILEKGNEDEVLVAAGVYTHPFQFFFPPDVPSTYNDLICKIKYYVKLTFERKGAFNRNKTFRTLIPAENTFVKATLPTEPIMYGAQKSPKSIFNSSLLNIKATIKKSALIPGETAEIDVELNNDTGIEIPTVKTKLITKVTRIANCGRTNTHYLNVEETRRGTETVNERSVIKFTRYVEVPENLYTIQAKILKRDYYFKIKAKLPFPHKNLVLEIPVEIGYNEIEDDEKKNIGFHDEPEPLLDDAPPSYWEIMEEDKMFEKENKEYEEKEEVKEKPSEFE